MELIFSGNWMVWFFWLRNSSDLPSDTCVLLLYIHRNMHTTPYIFDVPGNVAKLCGKDIVA
ncbi:hypothetical protein BVRB_1g021170 [Beta vulgaris subsp. vulgaris]|nr:hypothetical protein BVRB_1g021170 [Beta vulgaris subsp. vulgaris]